MKIIVEKNIPYIKGLLEPFGDVLYLPASAINNEAVCDADALFVRTRTICNESLLKGSKVKFIATATIGTDHIDLDYCRRSGIAVFNAPGCNAPAVAQYVFSVIAHTVGMDIKGKTLGVVGVGNVGKIIARWGDLLGMKVLRCDPPRQRAEGGDFVDLKTIAKEADIITFHTPLNMVGDDKTYHLADKAFLESLGKCELLINSSRGEVVDNLALTEAIKEGKMKYSAVDCWENEPDISRELLGLVDIATPHIAGYSAEGKSRATAMALEAFEKHFGVSVDGKPVVLAPAAGADVTDMQQIADSYNPFVDTENLRKAPENFEALRNNYDLRKEVM